MTAPPVAIIGAGMMTGVGLTAPASCAAIRCAIDNFTETRFMARGGEWIVGSAVPLEQPWRGQTKLVKMLAGPVRECLELVPDITPEQIPLLVCIAERDRPGRLDGLDNALFFELQRELGLAFDADSEIFAEGRVGGAIALRRARQLLYRSQGPHRHVIVSGVDTFLVGPTLMAYDERDRLLTKRNSNGFIPGEAGAAILLSRPKPDSGRDLCCLGLGFAREQAMVESEEPRRGEGLRQAIAAALAEAGTTIADMDFRITDISGEQYGFKEASLALSRLLRVHKEEFEIWHPADCIGEVGAAALPCMLGVTLAAARKGYAPGPAVLGHLANDDGKRAALVAFVGAEAGSS
jgi:3-oxoacyl-[acyl-carrier-protein] synthase-1